MQIVSVAYALAVISGGLAARTLGSFNSSRIGCYWTDAMFVFVECGPDAWLGTIRGFWYNLWLIALFGTGLPFNLDRLQYFLLPFLSTLLALLGVVTILWRVFRFFHSLFK
ncbi:hypothetical protein [Paracoccus haematequi]|nr:hypothetical protein [Paracoccus haematequi]